MGKTKNTSQIALNTLKEKHQIWHNPLLISCKNGLLTKEDFSYLFSQYYFYSKNFTKLISAGMINFDDDKHRAKLSQNLWEESGEKDIELRHSELFRKFLINELGIDITSILFEEYTLYFFKQYLDLCLYSGTAESAAILSFATEGIISKLYTIFKQGLLNVGIKETGVEFFTQHIICDDDHALTLEEIALSYQHEENWFNRCKNAIIKALDLRDIFFTHIHKTLQLKKLNQLVERASTPANFNIEKYDLKKLKNPVNETNNKLYFNENLTENIKFTVDRIPISPDILDPRILCIPPGFNNEFHRHAHETIFFVIEGTGRVIIDNESIPIKPLDTVFVPRWVQHQTINTGKTELKIFAVTDYNFTKRFPKNTEQIYRLNKENVAIKT
ncbi:MAG: Cupin protein [uncultured bacterium]|nr:MAG: Cupin protein [uncultured bacterium]OGT23698.1 MAG: hypothetical protein A2W47_02040 [Gammaproteobacteria bacterium RIFCSPHIGHO2_12_38_15]